MGIVALKGSRIVTNMLATPQTMAAPALGHGQPKVWCETVEVGAADSDTSTYHMARLPSNARLFHASSLSMDDLASSGSPTMDIGIYPVKTGDFTADVDAINDGIDAAAATNARIPVIKNPANVGKMLWEMISGVSVDPHCEVDIKIVLDDADVNVGGTVTMELWFATN